MRGLFAGDAGFFEFRHPLLDVRRDLFGGVALPLPAHDSFGLMTRAIPSSMRSKLETSRCRRFRPAAVIRYPRIRRFRAESFQSAATQPSFNIPCSAGYKEPSST